MSTETELPWPVSSFCNTPPLQVRHLKVFRHFFENDAFVYALLGLTFLTFLVLGLCDSPDTKAKEEPKLRPSGSGVRASKGGRDKRGGSSTRARAGVTVVTKV